MAEVKLQEKKVVETTIYRAPCIKCNSDDVKLGHCGYSTFNVGSGKCQSCGHTVDFKNLVWKVTQKELVEMWNDKNDIPTVVGKQEMAISLLRESNKWLKKQYKAQLKAKK